MFWVWILTFAAGVASVVQGGANRLLGREQPSSTVVLLNGAIFCFGAATYWWWRREPGGGGTWPWWSFLPGLLGFFFVLAVPYAIARLGATAVFVCLIAAQIAAGLVWDFAVEGATPSVSKLTGAALALAGAFVMTRGN